MFDIDVAVKNACRAYSYQRKPKIFWSIFRDDSYPRLFPEAKSLKIPSKAQMWPLPPTGLSKFSSLIFRKTSERQLLLFPYRLK
ncbi:Bgt-50888 [Blumeria graminis f. sp. tritici]|uniref:Bgt-50888 n=1 Tax=Blumeria graminis f. sp. tritici TaxID=62690 RepID=A0A9X9MJZ9_BLUGR|nr:Bgt-50888 [Blumeria graminis f. sp. tritici]